MDDHDQKRVKTMRWWHIGDQINRQLLEGVSTGQGKRGKCGDTWVGVNLHLLTKSAARNKLADKRGHTWPPIVMAQQGVSAKESSMAQGERGMDQGDKIMMSIRGNVKVVFKIKMRIRKMPIGK